MLRKEDGKTKRKITILGIDTIEDRTIPLKPQKKALVIFTINAEPARTMTFNADVAEDEKRLSAAIRQRLEETPPPSPLVGKTFEV